MNKIADFIYELNKTVPTVKPAYFDGTWDGVEVRAKMIVDHKIKVRLDILPEEIAKGDSKALATEVALKMEGIYRERMAMPLLEGMENEKT